jgi:SAM-dependent methyltransferase
MNCPLCCGESARVFEAKGFHVRDCSRCAHRFAEIAADENHVAQVYGDEYFSGGGAGYTDYFSEGEMLRKRGNDYAEILSKFCAAGKILDVGAAAGFILKGFEDRGWRGIGLEPNEAMAKFGRENLSLDLRSGDLENFRSDEKFDCVSMIQVAAHFHSPRRAFETARDLLRQGGLLLVETWNRESFTARAFGKHWHEYSPPSVLQWYSENGLTQFLVADGFEKLAKGRPSKKISGEHAKSILKYRLGENALLSAALKVIPDHLNIPYPAEDLFWAIYRKK